MEQYISRISFDNKLDKNSYLNNLPIIKFLSQNSIVFDSPVTFFVGENGTGKSTLLEAIAVAYGFNAEGGTKNFTFSTKKTHSELCDHLIISKKAFPKDGFFLRAESMYNVATHIDEVDAVRSYGGVSLHEQSHGESFLAVVHNRFKGQGLYILDEPEAALSPMRILALMKEMDWLVNNDSQFIISTHSPILMAFPGAKVFELTSDGIIEVDYHETEHFRTTKDFINNPERTIHYLFNEE